MAPLGLISMSIESDLWTRMQEDHIVLEKPRLSKKMARITEQINEVKFMASYNRALHFATDLMEQFPADSMLSNNNFMYFGARFMEQQLLFQQQGKPFKVTLAFQSTKRCVGRDKFCKGGLVSTCNPWGDKRKGGSFGKGVYVKEYPEQCNYPLGVIFAILPGSKSRLGEGDTLSDEFDTGIGNKGLASAWPLHSFDESLQQQDELILRSESQCLPSRIISKRSSFGM
jgi:hypothetical protein